MARLLCQGETVEDVTNEISYVASSLIELYKEENKKIPLKLKNTTEKESKNFSLNIPLIVSVS
jgi:predicted RNase H-like HicB family nuclease